MLSIWPLQINVFVSLQTTLFMADPITLRAHWFILLDGEV